MGQLSKGQVFPDRSYRGADRKIKGVGKTSATKLSTDVKKPVGGQMTHGEAVEVKRSPG